MGQLRKTILNYVASTQQGADLSPSTLVPVDVAGMVQRRILPLLTQLVKGRGNASVVARCYMYICIYIYINIYTHTTGLVGKNNIGGYGNIQLLLSKSVNECVQDLKVGTVSTTSFDEVLVASYSGRIS